MIDGSPEEKVRFAVSWAGLEVERAVGVEDGFALFGVWLEVELRPKAVE